MKAHITITLKNGVLDPQGKAIETTLQHLGFTGIANARQGKFIELELAETNAAKAEAQVQKMCETLLANMVIEDYEIALLPRS